jgi:hypothetical protein
MSKTNFYFFLKKGLIHFLKFGWGIPKSRKQLKKTVLYLYVWDMYLEINYKDVSEFLSEK